MVAAVGNRLWTLPEVARSALVSDEAVRRVLRKRRDLEPRRVYPGGPRLFTDAEVQALVAEVEARRK